MRKVSVEEQRELIPNAAIRKSFLERDDISSLPAAEQERRWQEQLVQVEKLRSALSRIDSIVPGETP